MPTGIGAGLIFVVFYISAVFGLLFLLSWLEQRLHRKPSSRSKPSHRAKGSSVGSLRAANRSGTRVSR